ncbi:ParB family chromosome partitioning protein [Streptomyces sp. CEV 2-1]|uniref:ParB/RepB/Spo0J family partition protein n=1 Tax=Streptomyces sp. CEV 2-1 TaxID=2485153 RepID=UPI000F4AE128|nr:ParB/RepB/Spo0J family partition protein [Streptomyces sp. CEV 2-1]ROQ65249.1 ParB family chromosome partitioning protein [Streptomyces sp. CEV 2-1]
MSKADELGAGRFGKTQGVSARRAAVAAATGAATVGAPDSRLRTIPLEQLVPTRFNPRRNFGSTKDLLEFGLKLKRKQLQPAVAVTRDAYLQLWKEEADNVGTARYVIANGERRFRGSKAADIGTLEVVVDDTIAASRADFLDAVLSENNDREDLDPIEQALGIQTMVEQIGGKAEVAKHYEKSAGWVTQQMYLLALAPELQALVSSGDLPVRETRTLVKLPHEEQLRAWQERALKREEEKDRPRTRRPSPAASQSLATESADGFTAVKPTTEPTGEEQAEAYGFTAVKPGELERLDSEAFTATAEPKTSEFSVLPSDPMVETGAQEAAEAALPVPRKSRTEESSATEQRTVKDWPLPPGGWKSLLDVIVRQVPEFDRHMLTQELKLIMRSEVGGTPDQSPSTSA